MGMHLMVGVDGSEPARRAVEYARDLAQRVDGRLTLLGVFTMPTVRFEDYGLAAERVRQQEMDRLHDELLRTARDLEGVPVATVLETGDPAEVLCAQAQVREADLLVVGCRGLGQWRGMLLGSVSSRVAPTARCPVLVVRG